MESVTTPTTNSGATAERSTELRKTPLNALHRKLGARMVNFGGWDMPVEYPATGGLIAEHKAVRNGVGVFDVSHMGDIRIRTGKTPGGALAAVQHLSMNDASKLAVGQAQYSALLYPAGTFVDDVIVHRLGEDDFLFVINAGTVSSQRLRGKTRPCYNLIEITDHHVDVWRKYPFHGQEKIIQFSTQTRAFEKYTARIEGEVTSQR